MLLATAVFACGCGKQERLEAVRLSSPWKNNQADFAAANSVEKDFVGNARAWSGDITANGAGHGVQLDQNGIVAAELAKSAIAISAQLGKVRQAVYDIALREEYPQGIRDALITELARRQKQMQDVARCWKSPCLPSWSTVIATPMWATVPRRRCGTGHVAAGL